MLYTLAVPLKSIYRRKPSQLTVHGSILYAAGLMDRLEVPTGFEVEENQGLQRAHF